MSGGAFNYAGLVMTLDGVLEHLDDLKDLSVTLREHGYILAAAKTELIIMIVKETERMIGKLASEVQPVWKAMEWVESGDASMAKVDRAAAELESKQ